ncbi:MAG: phospholipid:lipid palmitoyltransferase [Proteobacteria bacterium]|nr:phospholipid:lipid palmitoyltransferase [Pseudomonadota bacterium]
MNFRVFSAILPGLLSLNAQAVEQPRWFAQQWDAASAEVKAISEQGKWDFYEPVYAWHLPYAYNSGQRDRYNNTPWPAVGIGKGYYDEQGNRSGLYAMEFIDSNKKWSAMAGYGKTWLYGNREGFNYGPGVTAGLMTREDYFGRFPFPAILPTATLGYDSFKIETAYVAGFKKGTGNILFFWLKYELK